MLAPNNAQFHDGASQVPDVHPWSAVLPQYVFRRLQPGHPSLSLYPGTASSGPGAVPEVDLQLITSITPTATSVNFLHTFAASACA